MIRICMDCGLSMGEKEPVGNTGETHSSCLACLMKRTDLKIEELTKRLRELEKRGNSNEVIVRPLHNGPAPQEDAYSIFGEEPINKGGIFEEIKRKKSPIKN